MLGRLANHVVVLGAQRWTIVLELGGVVVVALLVVNTVLVMAWQSYCSLPVPFTFFSRFDNECEGEALHHLQYRLRFTA